MEYFQHLPLAGLRANEPHYEPLQEVYKAAGRAWHLPPQSVRAKLEATLQLDGVTIQVRESDLDYRTQGRHNYKARIVAKTLTEDLILMGQTACNNLAHLRLPGKGKRANASNCGTMLL